MFEPNIWFTPENGEDITWRDLDILDNNLKVEEGDKIIDFIERITYMPGPDDEDGLGRNEIPS